MSDDNKMNIETDSASGSEETITTKKVVKRYRHWIKKGELPSEEVALKYVKSIGIWSRSSIKYNRMGHKIEYRCSYGQFRKNECAAGIYLQCNSKNGRVSIFRTIEGHSNHVKDGTRSLPSKTKEIVRQLYENGITKPMGICNEFYYRNLERPNLVHLKNFLLMLKSKSQKAVTSTSNEKSPIIIKSDILDIRDDEFMPIETNSEAENPLRPFAIDYNVNPKSDSETTESSMHSFAIDYDSNSKCNSETTIEVLQSITGCVNDPISNDPVIQNIYSMHTKESDKLVKTNTQCSSTSQKSNERIDNFVKGILLKLQNLRKDQYLLAEKYINDILFKAEIEILS